MHTTMVLPDYHIHTPLCKHAAGDMDSYVVRAIDIGLVEIGFSDHMPLMPEPEFCMGYDDLPRYRDAVFELRERYAGRISIKFGCEMDIVHDRMDEIHSILDMYPFDYVIGSLHYLDGWPFDQKRYRGVFETGDVSEIYSRFFAAVREVVRTGVFDIVGHVDNIKRMGFRPSSGMNAFYEEIAAVCAEQDVAVEVNTGGFDTVCREQYPSAMFLAVLNRYGVPVTIGSDAHAPGQVGRHFNRVEPVLRDAGYASISYFTARRRRNVPLEFAGRRGEAGG